MRVDLENQTGYTAHVSLSRSTGWFGSYVYELNKSVNPHSKRPIEMTSARYFKITDTFNRSISTQRPLGSGFWIVDSNGLKARGMKGYEAVWNRAITADDIAHLAGTVIREARR